MKYFFIAAVLFLSCSHPKSNNANEANVSVAPAKVRKETFETGKVIPKVICKSNPAFSFALYLPSDYDTTKKFPAIIFFDPHAGGEFVVKKYQHLAEEFNFILIGSNDSKNGLSTDQTNQIAASLISDAINRYTTFDDIALAGFSGGAKVALSSAPQNQNVSSVIYCGAVIQIPSTANFSLLGFAGVNDMNYTDVIQFDQSIQNSSAMHFLIEWNGKHEWPDSVTFRNAFYWLSFNKMKTREIPVDASLIQKFKKEIGVAPSKTTDVVRSVQLQEEIVYFLKGLSDVSANEANLKILQSKDAYTNEMASRQKILQAETATKQQYMNDFQSQDLDWWKKETQHLHASKNPSDQRLLGFISLAGYSISNNAIQQNNFPVAEKMLAIYQLADPTNSDQAFLEACFYAKQGKNDAAIQSLQRAIELGLNDPSKITGEESLQPLLSDARLQALLAKLK